MKVSRVVFLIGLFTLTIPAAANETVLIDFNTIEAETSHSITEWRIVHPYASQTTDALRRSYIREVNSNLYGTVMGVRIFFPSELIRLTTHATIQPPFENNYGRLETERGIRLRSISVNVNSLYLPAGISLSITLRLNDRDNIIIPVGDLRFEGWRELTWINPYYDQEIENNTGFYDSVSFLNFIVYNGANHYGDTIFYIRDVKIAYDTGSN